MTEVEIVDSMHTVSSLELAECMRKMAQSAVNGPEIARLVAKAMFNEIADRLERDQTNDVQ